MSEQSENVKELATALAKAQAQLRPAMKESTNPHFKSRYADLSAIWEACREALTDNGLSVVQMPTDSGDGRVALTTMLIHASGEYLSSTCSTRLQQDSAQGVGSALTYLRRYALAAMVGIVADDDDDGNAASRPSRPQNIDRSTGELFDEPPPVRKPAREAMASAPNHPTNGGASPEMRELMNDLARLRTVASKEGVKYSPPKAPGEMTRLELEAAINALEKALGIPAATE